MLTKRQNLLETIRGGKPDRFVNQYEAFSILYASPVTAQSPMPEYGGPAVKDAWGVTKAWPEGTPGAFPVHDEEHLVLKDIEEWKKYVKAPRVEFSEEEWLPFIKMAEAVDRKETFATLFYAPGLFEQCHYLMNMQNCMIAFYECPDEMHELIDYITEFELSYAEVACKYLKPDAFFQHDDWGSQISTFLAPSMFEEFFLPSYKKIYGYYKEHGCEVIMHHSDSYAATLVPYMIDMGIDIWQGVMRTNKIEELIPEYGDKITFMGGIDSATVDFPHWTPEIVMEKVREACENYGKFGKGFIPCASQGLPMSTYPGVYEEVAKDIDAMSAEMFPRK
ncbi:MAG: uroporphyrinogen decarboxylase [Oscillospiraceae bacterium]|nr:uroporphyrinogen decarboxylase [Oscillospiraceae bacterium]